MRSSSNSTSPRRPAALATALALGMALAACADDRSGPLSPNGNAPLAAVAAATGAASPAAQLSADAVGRLLPALDKDAAAPVGNALRTLDATLRDAKATAAAKERSLKVVENTLAQFTSTERTDAADLDAMRLAVAEIRALLEL